MHSFFRSFRGLATLNTATLTLLGIAALGLIAHPAAAQGLNGQSVSTAFGFGNSPQTANYATNLGAQTVSAAGAAFYFSGGVYAVLTPNQIVLSVVGFDASGVGSDGFDGYRFSEVGTSPQRITGVSLDTTTNVSGFGANRLSFDATNIYANFSGLYFNKGQIVRINLTSTPDSPPVPEASTTASLGLLLALGGLAVAVRRKKASAA